ncbi:Na+/H+ antiporter subunit A [Halobacteriales archaeon QS_8_69_26]|nr:MAG: Na+/H+ antiporter subunit A [Halobacteriales archaeon QS_8_69_26]
MAPDGVALVTAVFLPFLAAPFVVPATRLLGERVAYPCGIVAAACFGLVASQFGAEGVVAFEWIPSLGVALRLYVDGLSLLVAFLASGVGVLVFVYSAGYLHGEGEQPRYYASLLVFMGSMLGLVLAADLITLFVFWELTSLSSFSLIGYYQRESDSQYGARKAMLVTVAGGLFLLVGFVVLYAVSGEALAEPTYALVTADGGGLLDNADAVRETLRDEGLLIPVLGLLAVGAGAKSAQVPLHVWLPNAMEAPTPVSAFLHSATMVKAGVYLVGRFRPLLGSPEWEALFVTLGLATMTVTAILAVAASDIKELLAYSTASHLGLIVAGFGFQSALGAETGSLHLLNHAMFKAALFLVAGIVAHEAGTRAIDDLGGLRHDLPITAGVTVVAALGMAGVPPFNGFYSKEFLFEAAVAFAEGAGGLAWLVPAVAVFGSVFTFLYSIRFLMLFFGDRPEGLGDVHRPPLSMLAPAGLLGVVALLLGLVPQVAVDLLIGRVFEGVSSTPGGGAAHRVATAGVAVPEAVPGVEAAAAEGEGFTVGLPTKLSPAVAMSAVTILAGLAAYPFYGRLRDGIRSVLAVGPTTVDWWYDNGVEGVETLGRRTIDVVQTGMVRTYATWAVGTFAALTLAGYLAAGIGFPAISGVGPGVTRPIVLVLLLAVVAGFAVDTSPSHVAGVLTLSILGFMIAIFYILMDAPDLALTQLLIETLVLVIFLLVLDQLPAFYGEIDRWIAVRDVAVSAVVGLTVFLTVAVSTAQTPDPDLPTYLADTAPVPETHGSIILEYGGGGNVVNVILVDFRAFDTLGEISVIAMAAISVLTLLGRRTVGGSE